MHVQSLLISLLLATTATAKEPKTVSIKPQCQKIRKLEWVISLTSNTTKLQEMTRNNTVKIAEMQADSSAASKKLAKLQSNSTIVSNCAVINAAKEQEDQCLETSELQSFMAFAANATAVAEKTDNNATRIAAVQAKLPSATTKLQSLMSNSTLQAACPAVLQKEECKGMMRNLDFIAKAGNQTILAKVTKGNTTKVDKIAEEVQHAEAKLDVVRKNQTFVDACMKMGMDLGKTKAKSIDSTAPTAEAAKGGKSIANGVQVGRIQVIMLSTILLVAAGMFML